MEIKPAKPEMPKILYQYRPPELWALENLSRRVIYFGLPHKFNDPYDCNIGLGIKHFMGTDFSEVGEGLLRSASNILPSLPKEVVACLVNDAMPNALGKMLREPVRVACFSEHNDNLLMWSHYAGRGEGFCLAFDTQGKELFADGWDGISVAPVNYTKQVPDAEGMQTMQGAIAKLWTPFLTHKSADWQYEKEWRMITSKDIVDEREYHGKSLKAVYFGTEAKKGTRELIRAIVKEKYPHAELWRGMLSTTEYKVEFDRMP